MDRSLIPHVNGKLQQTTTALGKKLNQLWVDVIKALSSKGPAFTDLMLWLMTSATWISKQSSTKTSIQLYRKISTRMCEVTKETSYLCKVETIIRRRLKALLVTGDFSYLNIFTCTWDGQTNYKVVFPTFPLI